MVAKRRADGGGSNVAATDEARRACPTPADLPPPPAGRRGWPWTDEPLPSRPRPPAPAALPAGEDWPRITVVTPSYNQAAFLEETIRSVLLQGYPNLEYMVVDGGSRDGSVEIVRKYERHLAWWTSEKDRGPGQAINKAFARASGEIHAYLNSDDVYEANALRAVGAAFRTGHRWIFGRVDYFQEGYGYWPVPQLAGRRIADWFVTCPICQPGCFWSAELHRRMGEFREDLGFVFDYEMWLRFRLIARVLPHWLDAPLAIYRLHPDSKTVAENDAFAPEYRRVRAEYEPVLGRGEKMRLWAARRRRAARLCGTRSVALLRAGDARGAARQLAAALRTWPFVLVDDSLLRGLRALGRRDEPAAPVVFRDGED